MNVIEEASRCLKCLKPSCKQFCPVHTDVPTVVSLFQQGKLKKAGEVLFANNPLSAVCSIVCPHENNCKGHCVLGIKGEPVTFHQIEQYISGFYLETFEPEPVKKNGKKIAIIGAGPSGIAMSILLAQKGYAITLIESKDKIGGVLRYGIPEFRLPKSILDKYQNILSKYGVLFKPNTFVGSTISIEDMFLDGYDAVFISVGTSRPNKIGLLGETLGNVHYAIDFLKTPEAYNLGKKAVIIGAGNVAMDAARMAVRKIGHGEVFVINNSREEDMSGNKHEIEMAKLDGVQFMHQKQAIKLCSDGVVCCEVMFENDEYTEDFTNVNKIEADTIIIAIGQGPQAASLHNTNVSKTNRGFFETDEQGNTNHKGVFAAGDVVTGPKTVVEAIAFTKKVAESIDKYCSSVQ